MLLEKRNNKISIMQGRVIPKDIERLQVFPDNWEQEFSAIKELGFDSIELLDDKKGRLRELLRIGSVGYFSQIKSHGINFSSICLDRLCDFSLLKNKDEFLQELDELLGYLVNIDGIILVLPFFDKNHVKTREELSICLEYLSKYDEQLQKQKKYLSLEIDLSSKIIIGLLREYSFSNIGICYDFGNSIGNKFDLKKDILLLKDYINHVHIKDKFEGKNVRLRKNNKQLKNGFSALGKINYHGAMCLETCISPDPLKEAKLNLLTVLEYIKVKK